MVTISPVQTVSEATQNILPVPRTSLVSVDCACCPTYALRVRRMCNWVHIDEWAYRTYSIACGDMFGCSFFSTYFCLPSDSFPLLPLLKSVRWEFASAVGHNMTHISPTVYTFWSIISITVSTYHYIYSFLDLTKPSFQLLGFLISHLWKFDRFQCLQYVLCILTLCTFLIQL